MSTIELIGAPQSVYVRAVRMMLEEKGVGYTLTVAPPHSDPVLSMNPFGKIPVLRHGKFELFESLAMMIYADRTFGGTRLLPEEPVVAARIVQWSCAVNTSVFPGVVTYMQANAFPKGPDGTPDRQVIGRELPKVQQLIQILDAELAHKACLAGDDFSLADMYLMPMLSYLRIFPESGAAVRSTKHLAGYFDRNSERPCFRATVPPSLSQLAS